LHFVLDGDASPRMQPTARRNVDIVANLKVIAKIYGHVASYLKIRPT
jgi:hypothetical protein